MKIKLLILLIFAFLSGYAQQAWTATSNGTWINATTGTATWSCVGAACSGTRPSPTIGVASKSITIPSGIAITGTAALVDGGVAGTLTIQGSLTATSLSLTNNGPTTVNGGGNLTLSGALTVNGSWSAGSSITANVNAGSFLYSGSNYDFTINGNLTTSGNIVHSGGKNLIISGNVTSTAGVVTQSGGLAFNIGGNLNSFGDITQSGGGNFSITGSATTTNGVVTQNGGLDFNVGGNLTSNGTITKTNGKNFIVGGNLTSTAGGLTINGGVGVFTVGGNTSLFGAYTIASGPSAQFNGSFSASSLSSTGGSGTIFNGPVTTSGAINMSGGTTMTFNSSLSAASVSMSGGTTINVNGSSSVSGLVNVTGNSTIKGGGSLSYGSFSFATGGKVLGNNSCSFTSTATLPPSPLVLSSCTLPIVLKDFKVKHSEIAFEFDWSTLQEINNDYFTLEYSLDSKMFIDFAKIEGAGTSYQTLEYQYEDSKLSFERDVDVVYFRLKQTDFDGTYAYSHVVPVMLSNKYKLSSSHFYPNPATETLTLRMEEWDSYKEGLVLDFINASGKVYSKSISINSTETKIDLTDLPKGIYMISSGGLLENVKLLVN